MPNATPIVFVVDDDVSVRESPELLVRFAGWQPETFASAQEFLARPPTPEPPVQGRLELPHPGTSAREVYLVEEHLAGASRGR